ncbi:glycosyltransferase family 4 protein [Yinghuangia soli]|uniref:D-inositol 3-phosphate glycosyltransferase n=1 Tax=Yinghuangia soli TaxID=2908204 RepID=A0AA41Q984_9ACTN|nr:glycosyltransferase family 4 protein [Yinghuangia soli]MCF2532674.1 glycosyltransferase family 4 protein [Yinghuangia soli]
MTRPRVAMLVANDITRDSRVQKVAYSAAEAGFEVLLLGYDANAPARPRKATRIGAAQVMRTGLSNRFKLKSEQYVHSAAPVDRARAGVLRAASFAARVDYKVRRRLMKSVKEPGTGGPGVKSKAKETLWKVYIRDGDWRRTARHLLLLEDAWSAVVEDFRPDVVHAHDMHTPGIGVRIADRIARSGGRRPKVVYDAHEYVAGVHMPTQRKLAYTGLEREFVRRADAVVTVSPTLAGMLAERYALRTRPTVVANAPMVGPAAAGPEAKPVGVREALGLAAGVPLLVYSGAISPARGVDVMIEAMPLLGEAHVVIVCGDAEDSYVRSLVARAGELGAGARIHTAPYVAPHQVPAYLASATVGVIPILHTVNHEIALITKYYEYMHARLPIVVSDVRAMAEQTAELGCGEVFAVRSTGELADRALRKRDAEAFAEAAGKVLADPARYAAAYTEELLAENSWEGQARILVDLYARLAGRRPEPLEGSRPFAETG